MLDEVAAQNFFNQMDQQFIQPEVNRRKVEGSLPEQFQIWQCLIRFPQNQTPIVEFNDEFGWFIENPKLAPDVTMEAGKTIYLHEIVNLGKVKPPEVDGKRVAFVYVHWTGYVYNIMFDFSPNSPDFDQNKENFNLGDSIAHHLRLRLIEMVVKGAKTVQSQLHQIGLWPIPSLLPYPISKIVERVGTGQPEDARAILVEYCNADFIEQRLIATWKPIRVFRERDRIFQEAFFAHKNQKFIIAIYTLVPQIEGIVTDWLYEINRIGIVNYRTESKIDQFHLMMGQIPEFELMWREALESTYEFLRHQQPMQVFKNWLDVIDPSFPGRHPVSHGKYVDEMFNEENSIKLFLLIDTICQFIMFYEVRVLGRNLEENQIS